MAGYETIGDTDLVVYRDQEGVDITAVTKLKHADLWRAAKAMGSQSALAKHLGVKDEELGRWVNLKECPPAEPRGRRWTEEFLTVIEGKLLALTGKSWDELFPRELRDNVGFLGSSKTIERTERVRSTALEQYALSTRERIERISSPSSHNDREELRESVAPLLDILTDRERQIVMMRYGFEDPDGAMTLGEIGRKLSLSRAYVGVIEARAIRKLQHPRITERLAKLIGVDNGIGNQEGG